MCRSATVFIHTRVLDEKGQKMSKTKGNGSSIRSISSMNMAPTRWRFALAIGGGAGARHPSRPQSRRDLPQFRHKLWNAARFCEMNECVRKREFEPSTVTLTVNKWIVAETARAVSEARRR